VTLAVYPLKGRRIELRGCRFIAVRGRPQLLTTIPSAWVSLDPSTIGSHSIRGWNMSRQHSPTPTLPTHPPPTRQLLSAPTFQPNRWVLGSKNGQNPEYWSNSQRVYAPFQRHRWPSLRVCRNMGSASGSSVPPGHNLSALPDDAIGLGKPFGQ